MTRAEELRHGSLFTLTSMNGCHLFRRIVPALALILVLALVLVSATFPNRFEEDLSGVNQRSHVESGENGQSDGFFSKLVKMVKAVSLRGEESLGQRRFRAQICQRMQARVMKLSCFSLWMTATTTFIWAVGTMSSRIPVSCRVIVECGRA